MLAFVLAGTSVITARVLSGRLGGFTITAVSLGLLVVFLLPFYLRKTVKTARLLKGADWKMIVLQAVFGIFLFRIFLISGVSLTGTGEAGILTGATPAITSLLAFLLLREFPSGKTLPGIGCTVAGILLLQGIAANGGSFSIHHFWGNVLVLCAAASESVFNVISRKHGMKGRVSPSQALPPMVQTVLVSTMALALCLVPALLEHPAAALQTTGLREWLALAWYGLVVTALAFAFFYAGVKRCGAYTTAAFSGMMPLTAMLLSVFLLGEKMGYLQWTGGAFIIFGMLLIGANPSQGKTKCEVQIGREI